MKEFNEILCEKLFKNSKCTICNSSYKSKLKENFQNKFFLYHILLKKEYFIFKQTYFLFFK